MRVFLAGLAIVLTAAAFVAFGRTARADAQIHVFQISCLPEVDLFEIRDLGVFDESRSFATAPFDDLTDKRYALYSPHWAFYQLDKPSEERDDPLVASPTRFECQLGPYKLELLVAPVPYSSMIWDIRVSLSIAGYWVVDDVPFEPCDDRGPITRLAFEGDQQALILEGRFGGVWPDLVSPNEAWDNRSRRFELEGYSLEEWVAAKRKQKTPVFSLTHEKIDYFQDESSGSYSSSVFDCYPYRWTPLRKPSTSRHSEP